MIFIFLISLFISCNAMKEKTETFPFLNLPPDLQILILKYVEGWEYVKGWESDTTFKKRLENTQQYRSLCNLEAKFPNKFKPTARNAPLYSLLYNNNKWYDFNPLDNPPPLPLTTNDLFAVAPNNSKIAALGYEFDDKKFKLFIIDFNNKKFKDAPWSGAEYYCLDAIALSSDGHHFAYLTHNYKNYTYRVTITNATQETTTKKVFSGNFSPSCIEKTVLEFNEQGTQIGLCLQLKNSAKKIVTMYTLSPNAHITFLKRLCTNQKTNK